MDTRTRPTWELRHRIARAREEAGMRTQADLARALDVDPKTVGRWEAGLHAPRSRDLRAIAEVTGVDYDWLAEDDDADSLTGGRPTVRSAGKRGRRGLPGYARGMRQGRARSRRLAAAR